MLDINIIRNTPNIVRQDLEKRKDLDKISLLDEVIDLDAQHRKEQYSLQELKASKNKISKEIASLKKSGNDASDKLAELKDLPKKVEDKEIIVNQLQDKINYCLMRLPNILHDSVPYGESDKNNVVVRAWEKPLKKDFELKVHSEVAENLDIADFNRATKLAGAGFSLMKGELVLLNLALMKFALDKLVNKGFIPIDPPLMMRKKAYEGVTDLAEFEEVLYKIEYEDLYLISTSEHAICAMHNGDVIDEDLLPLKYAGLSPCFRKEVGSHGIDEKGFFRMHQFWKIEQFIFSKPEDSWGLIEDLIKTAEEIYQALELPYRIVNICTGDIGIVAAKKYDLEVWMPRSNEYKEAISCSNCTDYQARRSNIRIGKEGGSKRVAHTLNSTAIATSRALVAILENYQNKDGSVTIPKVLVPYMNGLKVIKK